jgi:hypothetical protein
VGPGLSSGPFRRDLDVGHHQVRVDLAVVDVLIEAELVLLVAGAVDDHAVD